MITYKSGNLFDDDAQCLVNAVNCVGVMGAGIAKEFRNRWPEYYRDYRAACYKHLHYAGDVDLYKSPDTAEIIVSVATKTHWKDQSTLEGIARGLQNMCLIIKAHEIQSIAMPALGCGLGGLSWADVRPLIETHLEGITCDIRVYEPLEAA